MLDRSEPKPMLCTEQLPLSHCPSHAGLDAAWQDQEERHPRLIPSNSSSFLFPLRANLRCPVLFCPILSYPILSYPILCSKHRTSVPRSLLFCGRGTRSGIDSSWQFQCLQFCHLTVDCSRILTTYPQPAPGIKIILLLILHITPTHLRIVSKPQGAQCLASITLVYSIRRVVPN
jgi:hypothetical protein